MAKKNKKITFDSKKESGSEEPTNSTAENTKQNKKPTKKDTSNQQKKTEQNKTNKNENKDVYTKIENNIEEEKKNKEKFETDKIEGKTTNNKNKQNKDNKTNKKNQKKKLNQKANNTEKHAKKSSPVNSINFNKKNVESKHEKKKTKQELRAEKKEKTDRKRKIIKICVITFLALFGIYLLGVLLFSFVCFPNTTVANVDLSFRNPDSMKVEIENNAQDYSLNINGYDFDYTVKGDQIDYSFDAEQVIKNIKSKNNPFCWPIEIFYIHDFMEDSIIKFDKDKASSLIGEAVSVHNATASVPTNASLVCDAATKEVTIKPENIGNSLKLENVLYDGLGYIGSGRKLLNLTQEHLILPTLYASDERCEAAISVAQTIMNTVLNLMMASTQAGTLNANDWAYLIQMKDNYVVGLNDELLWAYIGNLAAQYDTVGKARTYTTPYGKSVTVSGGDAIGWQIDQQALFDLINEECKSGTVKTLEIPCSSKLDAYAGPGQRDWGPSFIDVDLSTQEAYYYDQNGSLSWHAPIVSGKPESPTPCGIYTIKAVTGPTTLLGQMTASGQREYESVVQHWMPFVGNMIGFHDAYWQSRFGGDWYVSHGSHGCINLSDGDAASLRSKLSVGVVVVVHN